MGVVSPPVPKAAEIYGRTFCFMTSFEQLLDSKQAASLLQIHPKTLQKMAREAAVPSIRVGDKWRFRASELDEWVRSELSSKRHPCRN
jgi:excisionase family DNA binding protein